MTRRRSTSAALVLMTLWGTAGCTLVSSWAQNASAPSATSTSLPLRPASRPLAQASTPGQKTTVAVISDFGQCDDGEQQVADMVRSWDPALIFSAGDNSQGVEGCVPFIESVGAYYGDYVDGPDGPRLYPALGNHDYEDEGAGLAAYRAYFDYLETDDDVLGRWHLKSIGDLNVYLLDSNAPADDMPLQQHFLRSALGQAAPNTWNVVIFHHPPFTSGPHDPRLDMRPEAGWNFKEWGVDLVINGHQHVLEDVVVDGLHYVTVGVGGQTLVRPCPPVRALGSLTCMEGVGAARLVTTDQALSLEYRQPGADPGSAYRLEIPRSSLTRGS